MLDGWSRSPESIPAMLRVLSVVGARPNFVKVGALHAALERHPEVESRILHTGQHYDSKMSDVFFTQLGLPRPDVHLCVGSGSHAEQTANIMIAFEREVLRELPDVVVVVGDVNSTIACALVCAKLHIPIAHVESGLRSGDRSMPEEVNRVLTDAIADYLFATEESALANLRREGVPDGKVFFTGNVMIDCIVRFQEEARQSGSLERLGLRTGAYVLVTMHRPATVDVPERLSVLVDLLKKLTSVTTVVAPLHPRTRGNLEREGLWSSLEGIDGLLLEEPFGYLEFLDLMSNAGAVVTDSGGVQEETTFLQVPCLTLRDSTERPITIEVGTNVLLPLEVDVVVNQVQKAIRREWKSGSIPPLWDGRAAERITEVLVKEVPRAGRGPVPD